MAVNDERKDQAAFELAVHAMQAELVNAGGHLSLDASARQLYSRQIQIMATELRADVARGHITWAQAAQQAQEMRNAIMEVVRGRSTPVGRAIAQKLKSEGRTLNELIARKTQQLHGPNAQFDSLTPAQKNAVYGEVVKSAGKANPGVTQRMRALSRAGRGLIVVSLALSVYTVANADDKTAAAGKELTVTGAGIGGGIAGGAIAGLACGPGAPVCVTVGAFVGGALAAIGVSALW
ncbi:MAG: hypothetical protein GAK30_01040 [Paracidovorax wautersii]|uniref:Uncharacterized protein n=1 Tax=Paracidovorax wautersii TaxID=1177982 RepID=A0A7V8JRF5_9BURK|nr:MAG: hypothetical protein GAK30_01040 [Paracidovorax wautersii]